MRGKIFRIAIDGPSGAGKSTIARAVASRLGVEYVDTGAMYRAVALKALERGVGADDAEGIADLLADTIIDFAGGRVRLDGRDVSDAIRNDEIAKMASVCSALAAVREKLVALQRRMGEEKSIVMDGRDIGSNVLPDAEWKFYLTASLEERACRRHKELLEKGNAPSFEQVLTDITERDYNDSHRALNPLVKAAGAEEIDSTDMTVSEVTDWILRRLRP
jgi:cytidylate kinase